MFKEQFSVTIYTVKLMVLFISLSIVNFIVVVALLKESRNLSMSVLELLYTIRISSTYREYPKISLIRSTIYILVCSLNFRYISERMKDVGHPLHVRYFGRRICSENRSRFVSLWHPSLG